MDQTNERDAERWHGVASAILLDVILSRDDGHQLVSSGVVQELRERIAKALEKANGDGFQECADNH